MLEKLWVRVHLYTNDREPRYADVIEDYIELHGHGYSSVSLAPSDWQFRRSRRDRLLAEANVPMWEFSQGPREVLHGYFVTSQADQNVLLWADRLDRPIVLLNNGERFAIRVQFRPFPKSA